MECVSWSTGQLQTGEEVVHEQTMVTVLSYDEKSGFQRGKLRLTNNRLFWHDSNDYRCVIEIHLSQITNVELKSPTATINRPSGSSAPNRQVYARLALSIQRNQLSNSNYICEIPMGGRGQSGSLVQFEFEYGGHNEFQQQLNQQIGAQSWAYSKTGSSQHTVGIAGIQRKIQDRLDMQDQKINDSFKDLSKLMDQAKEMVGLSNTLIAKISKNTTKSSSGPSDEDDEDMKTLKSYFFNMGIIDNPVTKEESGSKYYKALAMEIFKSLSKVIVDHGGIMTLADVYCRLNRARGIAGLVSVEDLLNACKELNRLDCELKYNVYKDINLHVLEIVGSGQQNKKRLEEICQLVEKNESMTPYVLSNEIQSSLIVAKKLLTDAESLGMLCRDDTYMGLRFYPNLFLQKMQF